MKTLLTSALLATCLLTAPLAAQQLIGILPTPGSSPPINSALQHDIVVVFDGYTNATAAGQATTDANAFRTALLSYAPYAQYQNYLNIWGIYRQSNQAGADHPATGVLRDTAYNAAYDQLLGGVPAPRCVLMTDGSPQPLGTTTAGLTRALVDAATIAPDQDGGVLCIVNDPAYGGCASFAGNGAAYNGTALPVAGPLVAVHELGHISHFVHDEYNGAGNYTGGPLPQVNVTSILNPLKWQSFVTAGLVGTPIAGGLGFNSGVWHPAATCMMNDATSPFCPVCAEKVVLDINASAERVLSVSPAAGTTVSVTQGGNAFFSVVHRVPGGNGMMSWTINGAPFTGGTTLGLNTTGWVPGSYAIQATLVDTNPLVLNDPNGIMTSTLSWTLDVLTPAPDLTVTNLVSFVLPVEAGANVDILSVLDNTAGTGPANSVLVDYFLMSAPGLPNPAVDWFLGNEFVPAVAAGGTVQLISQMQVPYFSTPGTYYLGAIADRADNITELNEANNSASDTLGFPIVAITGCPTALEFNLPLSFQGAYARMSEAAGASLPLEVTSPCQAGDWFVVLISVSGTSPGIVLAPGLVIPVNQDFVTDYALTQLNVFPYVNFLAQLDGAGRGSATFAPPPGYLGASGFKINLAAATLQLTNPTTFTAVSNAVTLAVDP